MVKVMDLEFFVHGVPNGQKIWGKKDDSLYLNPEFYGIAVNKNNKALAERLNAGLEKIAASGELKAIHEKWFGVAD